MKNQSLSPVTFRLQTTFDVILNPTSIKTADFNLDGKIDLVVGGVGSKFSILLGDGLGGFTTQVKFLGEGGITALGDFNRDGKADLIVPGKILLGDGVGGFETPKPTGLNSNCAVSDFNGDGKLDLVTPGTIYLGDGLGGFDTQTTFSVGDSPLGISVGDFNRDGKPDVAIANYGDSNISVLLGNGFGGLGTQTTFTVGKMPYSLNVSDFNDDGNLDIVAVNGGSRDISILLGDGNGGFSLQPNIQLDMRPYLVNAVDLNSDGNIDLVVLDGYGLVLLGDGKGGFSQPTRLSVGRYPVSVASADLNSDGKTDLVTANYDSGDISVLLNNTVPNSPPSGNITILGSTRQGQVLTTSININDVDGVGALTGQWFRDGFAVTGATDVSYTLTQADVGKSISATAYYTDGLGKLESINSNEVKIANINDAPIGNVTISGTATQNQILTANNTLTDVDGLGTITYQWLSNNKEISNATQSTYKLSQSDVGIVICVKASYTDGFGTKETVTSSSTTKIGNVNDPITGTLSISGLAAQGQTLTTLSTLADLDGLGTIKYQWLSNGAVISGATKSSYVLGASDAGKTISVKASYTDLLGTSESVMSQSPDAVISTKPSKGNDVLTGTAKNDTLSALAGNDILAGGLGADKLTGGLGADIFKYTSIDDSGLTVKTRDTITDFKHSQSDKIDLSAIALPSDQSFTYIGTIAFSPDATAQLRLDPKTGILYGSTNADNTPEFSILLSGVKSLVPEDFIL